jgi:hypothetical protein
MVYTPKSIILNSESRESYCTLFDFLLLSVFYSVHRLVLFEGDHFYSLGNKQKSPVVGLFIFCSYISSHPRNQAEIKEDQDLNSITGNSVFSGTEKRKEITKFQILAGPARNP